MDAFHLAGVLQAESTTSLPALDKPSRQLGGLNTMGNEPGSHGSLGFCCMLGKAGRSVPFSVVHGSPLTLPSALERFLPQSHRDPTSTPLLSQSLVGISPSPIRTATWVRLEVTVWRRGADLSYLWGFGFHRQ